MGDRVQTTASTFPRAADRLQREMSGGGSGKALGEDAAARALARFLTLAWVAAAATFLLLLVGAGVVATGAGLSCPGWPLCGGRLVPDFVGVVVVEWSHRVGALTVTVLSVITAASAWPLRRRGPWMVASLIALAMLVGQVVLGAFVVTNGLAAWAVVAHEGLGILLLCVWIGVAVLAGRERSLRPAGPSGRDTEPNRL